jgi:serine/threonine-protein kinase
MDTMDAFIGQVLEDRYELIEKIGEGGMAVVYKARDKRLNRLVAVKIMRKEMAGDRELRQRFFAESQAVAMLSSPNIVAVYDVSHSADIEYIVMELVDGITLQQYMKRKGPIPSREAVYFAKQIARALAHAHARGVVHRDIKPHNMLLLRDGTLKVGDFGIAALENEVSDESGTAVGSIHYIAPEQIRGEVPDARSDLYSLGVVLYEMLTGQRPFTGDSVGEIAVKHINTSPVPPRELVSGIHPELERITLRAMQPDIHARYQSAEELIADLENFTALMNELEDEAEAEMAVVTPSVVPVRSVSEMSKEKYRRRRRRSARVSYLTGTLCVLLVAIGLGSFLLRYFVNDLFRDRKKIEVPNFVGKNITEILNNPSYADFRFVLNAMTENATVVYMQEPSPGTRVLLEEDGVPITLSLSSDQPVVPDVNGMDYRQASSLLRYSGYYVEIIDQISDTVPRNTVMAMTPTANELLDKGSWVYLTVSAGPEIQYISAPNLVGLSETAAIEQIDASELYYGGSEYESSDLPAGTVIGQSVAAYSQYPSHGKVILRVSKGPDAA